MGERAGAVERVTGETSVRARLVLAPGESTVSTGVGFLDDMLQALARHAGVTLQVEGWGDVHVDSHHTVEDVGLTLGACLNDALGERAGIARYGFAYAPLDEALARAVVGPAMLRRPELVQRWLAEDPDGVVVGSLLVDGRATVGERNDVAREG